MQDLMFCRHRLVFHSAGSALGSVVAGSQGLPRGLLKLLASLTFFFYRQAPLAIFPRQDDKQMVVLYQQLVLSSVEISLQNYLVWA